MKLERIIPIIKGKGDFDSAAIIHFAEKVLNDKTSTNVELTLAHNLRRATRHVDFWVKKYTETPKEAKWIPVTERLPEDGTYLCTLDGALCGQDEPFTGMCGFYKGKWDEEDCVIAWKPFPDVYKK